MPRPKKPPVVKPIPLQEPEEETVVPEAVELEFEFTDTEVKPQSATDQAKDWFSGLFKGDKSEETTAEKAKAEKAKPATSRRKGKFFSSKKEVIVRGFITALGWFMPTMLEEYTHGDLTVSLMPSDQQATNIIEPLLSILDRHSKMDGINPDLEDASDCIVALIAYGIDTRNNLKIIAYIKYMEGVEREKQRQNTFVPSDLTENIGVRF